MGRFVKNFEVTQNAANSISVPQGATTERPENPEPGAIRFNNTLNQLEFFNGTSFVGVAGGTNGKASITADTFTMDGSTAAFTMTQSPTADQNVLVFMEGVHQPPSTYSTSGTTITLTVTPADNGKIVTVFHGFDTV